MNLFTPVKLADTILKLIRGDFHHLYNYEYRPQKTEILLSEHHKGRLPRAMPESQGVSSKHLSAFLKAAEQAKDVNLHSVVVLRHGKSILEAHFKPYRGDCCHQLYSLSKTFVATAVGIALREGLLSLDAKVVSFFPNSMTFLCHPRMLEMTVEHLLTMQSGVRFQEVGSVMEQNWARGFLQSDVATIPGEYFHYNSMNSYMLCAILKQVTGVSLVEYLTPRLFLPLCIEPVHWETCPQGIEKGGWGLSLRVEDIAKLGQLYLQKGVWMDEDGHEKRILEESFVEAAARNQLQKPAEAAEYGYGYQMWMCPMEGAYAMNGVFGQYVIVLPRHDLVIAMTAGSATMFLEGSIMELVKRYFDDDKAMHGAPLPIDKGACLQLVRQCRSLIYERKKAPPKRSHRPQNLWRKLFPDNRRQELPLNRFERRYHGKTYLLRKNCGALLPLVIQGVHGNFTDGVDSVRFDFTGESLRLILKEGDIENTVAAGFDGEARYSRVEVNGEPYLVGGIAAWNTDEEDRPVLKVYLSFIETPSTRVLKFIFEDNTVRVRFDEIPSVTASFHLLTSILGHDLAEESFEANQTLKKELMQSKMKRILTPKTVGILDDGE